LASQDAKFGEFYEDSACKQQIMAYFSGEKDLVTLSKELAHTLEEALIHTEEKKSTDLIVADIRVDEERKLVVFQCSSHMGFVHQVNHTEQALGTISSIIMRSCRILHSAWRNLRSLMPRALRSPLRGRSMCWTDVPSISCRKCFWNAAKQHRRKKPSRAYGKLPKESRRILSRTRLRLRRQ
ncbi:MAG: nucleoid-associated protein, partial [Selenomonadaceae bacterium]|nr:nucleoid-associated protein [Selenomonadaceae bacterium]